MRGFPFPPLPSRCVGAATKIELTEIQGGLNWSMQHWLEVYSLGFQSRGLSRTLIEAQSYLVEIGLRVAGQGGFLREVLSQQPVGIFIGARC
jgi:hypothetical protein